MSNNLIRNQYLAMMGIDVWLAREDFNSDDILIDESSKNTNIIQTDLVIESNTQKAEPGIHFEDQQEEINTDSLDWIELENKVTHCQLCQLHQSRKNSIFGRGNQQADLFIIGSIPSQNEDLQAQEFIDTEGQLLDNMLLQLNLTRNNVYITNFLKCASNNNRQFTNSELEQCYPYLARQIELVKPKVLLLFGESIAQYILKTDKSMSELTSQMHDYLDQDILIVVIEHPEKLLISSSSKKQALLNILSIKAVLS